MVVIALLNALFAVPVLAQYPVAPQRVPDAEQIRGADACAVLAAYATAPRSPSDMAEERLAVAEAVNEWNAQHAAAEGVVLLPVKWETHALPTSGVRPQEAINRQLIDECDVLIGMFWTRLGTSTGVADSGTAEEIERFVAAKKPAMLYVSERPVSPGNDADRC